MALALVMALSLCTFVTVEKADAAFTDVDELSSQYAEQAADVIQTIEVMDGYDDGSFRPTAGLTRQAAAKIICNMILGPTTARALPTNANPFPDVLAGNQFSGYISYCAQQGIISGYGDGTFRPGDPLSGYAYLKMLLGALGYDAQTEGFVGDNWKVNVAKIALGIGLNRGIEEELDGATQVTRESAAIYAFNTLQADMVEYESKNTLEINGVKVSMGGGNATPQTWGTSATQADHMNAMTDTGAVGGRPLVQFAERYFDKLVREPNGAAGNNGRDMYTQDDFGRPSVKWTWKGVDIGTYSRDPDAVFVGGVKVNAIYEALGMTSGSSDARLYINSKAVNSHPKVERGNDKDLDHATNMNKAADGRSTDAYISGGTPLTHRVDRIGDGCIIECFLNTANNEVDICVISVYAGKIDAVKGATAKKDAYVTITPGNGTARPDGIMANADRREYETEDFEEDDIVAYTYSDSDQSIQDMYALTAESGTLQSKVSGKSLRLDDTTYKYGKEYTFDDITENDLHTKSSYIVYLDENDFVLWVEEDEFAVDDYALIERITIETTDTAGVTTKTASVLGAAAVGEYNGDNDEAWQLAYNQSKAAVGTSSWDAQAQLRYSNGTRRTVTLDDSKNYRTSASSDARFTATYFDSDGDGIDETVTAIVDPNGNSVLNVTPGVATIKGDNRTNADGSDSNGNWIAELFTAGHIVRVSSNSAGYRLHSINGSRFYVRPNFRLASNQISWYDDVTPGLTTSQRTKDIYDGTTRIDADSETHFVIEDVASGSFKTYVGVKNAPDVAFVSGNSATAYIYHTDGTAKLVYVLNGRDVSSSSNDIVFIAANSKSNLVEDDDGFYYEVTAVDKNEVKTFMVKENTTLYMGPDGTDFITAFNPSRPGDDTESNCVILNKVTTDSNDFITGGVFRRVEGGDRASKARGIRRVNSEEVRIGTYYSNYQLKDVADNVRVFFVDGDEIEQIDYSEIVNDTLDYVYYVEDDGEITYLFIVNADDADATATIPAANLVKGGGTRNFNVANYIVAAGSTVTFTVVDNTDTALTDADGTAQVWFQTEAATSGVWYDATYNAGDANWSIAVPGTMLDGSTVDFRFA